MRSNELKFRAAADLFDLSINIAIAKDPCYGTTYRTPFRGKYE